MRVPGRIAARGWQESPLDRRHPRDPSVAAHDRVFYLSVDRDTTSRYWKHYFRWKYVVAIGESKSDDVPRLDSFLYKKYHHGSLIRF